MKLWRLSTERHAGDLQGGYGIFNDGRWNSAGHPCIYAAAGSALPVLEKRVHVTNPALLPVLTMVEYDLPDHASVRTVALGGLVPDWIRRQDLTQQIGDDWLRSRTSLLLAIPSAIVPLEGVPDVNILINPAHPEMGTLKIARMTRFSLDTRLFS